MAEWWKKMPFGRGGAKIDTESEDVAVETAELDKTIDRCKNIAENLKKRLREQIDLLDKISKLLVPTQD